MSYEDDRAQTYEHWLNAYKLADLYQRAADKNGSKEDAEMAFKRFTVVSGNYVGAGLEAGSTASASPLISPQLQNALDEVGKVISLRVPPAPENTETRTAIFIAASEISHRMYSDSTRAAYINEDPHLARDPRFTANEAASLVAAMHDFKNIAAADINPSLDSLRLQIKAVKDLDKAIASRPGEKDEANQQAKRDVKRHKAEEWALRNGISAQIPDADVSFYAQQADETPSSKSPERERISATPETDRGISKRRLEATPDEVVPKRARLYDRSRHSSSGLAD